MHLYIKLTFELLVGFIGLIISVRVIGRRQMQQVTPFDFVSAVVLGEIVGNILYDHETHWYHMLYGIFIWTLFSYLLEVINSKSLSLRKVISGTPSIIIDHGIIKYDVMKKEKIDFNELLSFLRQKDVFSVTEVLYAFVETSGAVSVMKKSQYEQPTREDMKVKTPENNLNLAVICDGQLIKDNLNLLNITEDWVLNQLKSHGITDSSSVLYAEYDSKKFYYQPYYTKQT